MNNNTIHAQHFNLLWTGGWDSTFQLLQLLVIHRVRVTPYYLIDAARKSTGHELLAMKRIKDELFEEYPHTKLLLEATQYSAVSDISPDTEIANAFQSALKTSHIGNQHEWLARYCKENGIADMQLGLHRQIYPSPGFFDLEPIVSLRMKGSIPEYVLDSKYKKTDVYVLFKYFSFPLIKITKPEMSDLAKEHGLEKLMNLTWFCHKPTPSEKPCGVCHPCITVIDEDCTWRIPPASRVRSFIYRKIYWPFKAQVKSVDALHSLGKKINRLVNFRNRSSTNP